MRRARNAERREQAQPESARSQPRAYVQSIRARTAAAAGRSDSPSATCLTVTRVSRHGASAGRPRAGSRAAKSASAKTVPRTSRLCRERLPLGQAARATPAVSSGTGPIGSGCRDTGHLQQGVAKEDPHVAPPGSHRPGFANGILRGE
jgi:hypothetical protein